MTKQSREIADRGTEGLAEVFGVDANHHVGTSGDELGDGIALGIGEGNAPVSCIGKAAFVQVLDGGEDVLSFSHEQDSEGAAWGGGVER